MTRAGIRELRQNLSKYVDLVKQGETVEVTERGTVVARLLPAVPEDDPLAELERRGLIAKRARGSFRDFPSPPPAPPGARPLSEVLEELRRDFDE